MLTLISESAAQVNLPLVTIDPGTIVFTLINTLIIFILFKVFPVSYTHLTLPTNSLV